MGKFIVYLHTCLLSGKSYVGWTYKTIEERWNEHCSYSFKKCRKKYHFNRAIAKYGTNTWLHSTLEEFNTREEAKAGEIRWIAELQTYGNDGYNETRGGDGAVGHKLSVEACLAMGERKRKFFEDPANREKISKSVKARMQDPELKQRITDSLKATYANPETRKHVSDGILARHQADPSYREKLREAQRGNSNASGHKLPDETKIRMLEARRTKAKCKRCGGIGHFTKDCTASI